LAAEKERELRGEKFMRTQKNTLERTKDRENIFYRTLGKAAKVLAIRQLAVCIALAMFGLSIFAQPGTIVVKPGTEIQRRPEAGRAIAKPTPDSITVNKPDFPTQTISEEGKVSAKPIPDSFVILFNEDELQPFIKQSPAKDGDNREAKANDAKKYEQKMTVALKKLAQEKLEINPAMITEYYTTAFTGIKVQIKNEHAKGLLKKLKAVKEVAALVQDFEVNAIGGKVQPAPNFAMKFAQYPSWGTNFVGSGNYVGNKWAWVLDTGIDTTHPDLNVLTSAPYSASFISGQTFFDGNGHGTHVAGIIGARNNNFGTLGVAANATVVPVKVLADNGSGSWSALLSGLNHVAKYYIPGDVVNMSLGGPAPDWFTDNFIWWDSRKQAENAIRNLGNAGVFVVMAAGNENQHANNVTPARTNGYNLFTISNMDWNRNIAASSNYGNVPVDYAAPGSSILSTYRGGGYAYLSGTSMAAPFVSGILLINNGAIRTNGVLNYDKDSVRDPIAIK
jgi:subtilisin family serine protease